MVLTVKLQNIPSFYSYLSQGLITQYQNCLVPLLQVPLGQGQHLSVSLLLHLKAAFTAARVNSQVYTCDTGV